MDRRRFLATVGTVPVTLGGCLGANAEEAIIRAVQKSAPADATVVSYDDLSRAEQRIVRTAVEEGFYHACPPGLEAVRQFAERVQRLDSPYLAYRGQTYGLWIAIQDTVRADTASPPEANPSCGVI